MYHNNSSSALCCDCSPFETVDTAAQQPTFTHQTSSPVYANDTISNSGTLYEEISTDHGAGAGTMRVMVRALYDYVAVEDDEISLTAGNVTSRTCIELLCVRGR